MNMAIVTEVAASELYKVKPAEGGIDYAPALITWADCTMAIAQAIERVYGPFDTSEFFRLCNGGNKNAALDR